MKFTHAITRLPGVNFARGITTARLGIPKYSKIIKQHDGYVETLESLGVQVLNLEPLVDYPDAYFVEDVAIILPQIAVITLPGAAARFGEQDAIKPVLSLYRPLEFIQSPGRLDGGDVLLTSNHCFIGISQRTNSAGAEQLGEILKRHGYTWTTIPVRYGLHLKSNVNYIDEDTLLVNKGFSKHDAFKNYKKIVLDEEEESACNSLWLNGHLIMPAGFPGAREKLETLEMPILELDVSEVRKMDGGLTCMSLRFSQEN